MYGLRNRELPLYFQFRPKYLDGLKDGTWFASSTVLGDVGAGMKLPVTPAGRLLSILWVMFGLFLLSFVTSVISSTLTEAKLRSDEILTVADVAGKRVCMQAGFYEYVFSSSFPSVGIQKTTYEAKIDCFHALKNGEVDAVFGVREEFVNYFSQGLGSGLLASPVIKSQEYCIAFAEGWPYAPDVNAAILTFREGIMATQPSYKDMIDRWYSGDANVATYGGKANAKAEDWNWGLIGTAIAFVVIYMLLQVFVLIVAYMTASTSGQQEEKDVQQFGSAKSGMSASMKSTKSFVARMANKISSVHPEDEEADASTYAGDGGLVPLRSMRSMSVRNGNASGKHVTMEPPIVNGHELASMMRALAADVSLLKANMEMKNSSSSDGSPPDLTAVISSPPARNSKSEVNFSIDSGPRASAWRDDSGRNGGKLNGHSSSPVTLVNNEV
ncbi:hypothetical protein TSOC_005373 [Tetrabaena socialis]|uniref:Uncharacterized protein n=1 Tax=Tetrabaena socialis TaxID=47790 RepID=A0A2J8A6E4_9CHLO|nr:hypothetical protein TSOC_005373 [Tetrabaena socialis]|eukprot:PNH08101.1 hypothetical protein TSOC_005373 [Tetrabaena socialis]